MISKQEIQVLKDSDLERLYSLIHASESNKNLVFILENLGKLPPEFDASVLVRLLDSSSDNVRYWAVKNIGKVGTTEHLDKLYEIATTDSDSLVRREAVSSIGRARQREGIPHLLKLLEDSDPKVAMQAIRGLLVFKSNPKILIALKKLIDHPNEQIQRLLRTELEPSESVNDYGNHPDSPPYMRNVAVLGDVRDVLGLVPHGSIHLTFTSPPYYNARDYSIYNSYEGYLDFLTEVFQGVKDATKEGRFLIVNTSPIIIPRISRAYSSKRYPIPFDLHARLVSLGWEFIDDIVWAKPEASVKNRIGGFMQHRKPLAYKPNLVTEYLMVYRKETTKLLDWNMKQYDSEVIAESLVQGDYETTNLWQIDPRSDKVHTAIFPEQLCQHIVRYYSYRGDLVFDPFGGSGTLAKVALQLDRYFFTTEIMPEYFERIKENIGVNMFQSIQNTYTDLEGFAERKRSL